MYNKSASHILKETYEKRTIQFKKPPQNNESMIRPIAMNVNINKILMEIPTLPFKSPKFEAIKIPIYKFDGKLTPEYSRKITAFLTGCLFSESIPSKNEADIRYVSMYLSLGVFINQDFIWGIPSLLQSYNMVCDYFDLNENSLDYLIENNKEYQQLYEKFCLDKDKKSYTVTIIFVSLAFIFMGKMIVAETNKNYFYNRYNAIASVTENSGVAEELKRRDLRPVNTYCGSAHTTISGLFRVRKELFLNILSVTKKSNLSMWTDPLKVAIKFLEFSEMTHIELINRCLLDEYPELMTIKCLSCYKNPLIKALKYISSINEDERPFIKLLYDREETQCLNRNLFDTLIVAATTVAEFNQKSKHTKHTKHIQLRDIINSYLSYTSNKSSDATITESLKMLKLK